MNYSQCDKMVSDMEAEVDIVYKIALLMLEYVKSRDVYPYDEITDDLKRDVVTMKKNITALLLYNIDAYKHCKMAHVRNEAIVRDRKAMSTTINQIKLKVLSDNYDLDDEIAQASHK